MPFYIGLYYIGLKLLVMFLVCISWYEKAMKRDGQEEVEGNDFYMLMMSKSKSPTVVVLSLFKLLRFCNFAAQWSGVLYDN